MVSVALPTKRELLRTAETLLIAAVGGVGFTLAGFPAGLISGSLLSVAAAALVGRPVMIPLPLSRVISVLVGISLGAVVTPETLNDPQALQNFQAAQGELTNALKSLLVVVERYPELKSDQNFRDLQAQLEGTENRIAVARNRYIEAVQTFNATVRRFPVNLTAMVFGYEVKPNFTVENEAEISRPPTVEFDTAPPATPAPAPAPAPAQPEN